MKVVTGRNAGRWAKLLWIGLFSSLVTGGIASSVSAQTISVNLAVNATGMGGVDSRGDRWTTLRAPVEGLGNNLTTQQSNLILTADYVVRVSSRPGVPPVEIFEAVPLSFGAMQNQRVCDLGIQPESRCYSLAQSGSGNAAAFTLCDCNSGSSATPSLRVVRDGDPTQQPTPATFISALN